MTEQQPSTYPERVAEAKAERELIGQLACVARKVMAGVLTNFYQVDPESAERQAAVVSFETLFENTPLKGIGQDRLRALARKMGADAALLRGQAETIEDIS